MTTLEYIYDVLDEKDSGCYYPSTVDIARVIATFAHSGQFRENGERYFEHPSRCATRVYELLYENGSEPGLKMSDGNLLCEGLIELAYLHDVVEDTEITHNNIQNIYQSYGYGEYFHKYIDKSLRLITHKKKDSYAVYIEKVITNPSSSFVKIVDLMDNLNFFSLGKFGDEEYERAKKYLLCFKNINDKYHFVEQVASVYGRDY